MHTCTHTHTHTHPHTHAHTRTESQIGVATPFLPWLYALRQFPRIRAKQRELASCLLYLARFCVSVRPSWLRWQLLDVVLEAGGEEFHHLGYIRVSPGRRSSETRIEGGNLTFFQ